MPETPSIKVWAATENVRKYVTHPLLPRVKFPDDISQPLSWPDDSFTKTRLRDGEVLLEPPPPPAPEPEGLKGTISADAEVQNKE
jgi:hypothetical protein